VPDYINRHCYIQTIDAQPYVRSVLEELAASASTLKTMLEKKDAQLARSDKIIEKLRKDVSRIDKEVYASEQE